MMGVPEAQGRHALDWAIMKEAILLSLEGIYLSNKSVNHPVVLAARLWCSSCETDLPDRNEKVIVG